MIRSEGLFSDCKGLPEKRFGFSVHGFSGEQPASKLKYQYAWFRRRMTVGHNDSSVR